MAHNNATWNSNFGYAPIEKEEFYIGSGDSRPYWYQCCECRRKYGDTKPLQNTVCGQTLVLYSKEKLRFSITESFPFYDSSDIKKRIENEIIQHQWNFSEAFKTLQENLTQKWKSHLSQVEENFFAKAGEIQDYWNFTLDEILEDLLVLDHQGDKSFLKEEKKCCSTTFKFEQHHGQLLDVRYGEWLNIWYEIQNASQPGQQ